jgi:ribosome-binding ATPase YchF (GTP1/OBG family)
VAKAVKAGSREAAAEEAWLREVIGALEEGKPARSVPVDEDVRSAARSLGLLTSKPVLFVANVEEGSAEVPLQIADYASSVGALSVAVSARTEAELAELDDQEAAAMRSELGLSGEGGLERLARAAFSLLELIAFFAAGEAKPAQSWHLKRGDTAWHAAGAIHTDIQKGFVRAEVIGCKELVDAGGYAAARDRGTLRLEGRDYVMADGDVINVKFTR